MDSADLKQTLVYADGYSYTEIFAAPDLPGKPGGHKLVSVFHALFSSVDDSKLPSDELAAAPHLDTGQVAGNVV